MLPTYTAVTARRPGDIGPHCRIGHRTQTSEQHSEFTAAVLYHRRGSDLSLCRNATTHDMVVKFSLRGWDFELAHVA